MCHLVLHCGELHCLLVQTLGVDQTHWLHTEHCVVRHGDDLGVGLVGVVHIESTAAVSTINIVNTVC